MALSMAPFQTLLTQQREWLKWHNLRNCCTKECPRRNKEVCRLVTKCSTELRWEIMLEICKGLLAHKQAKERWELVQWLEKCRPQASMRLVCRKVCGLLVIWIPFLSKICLNSTSLQVIKLLNSLQLTWCQDKTNSQWWKSDNLTPALCPPKRDQLWQTTPHTNLVQVLSAKLGTAFWTIVLFKKPVRTWQSSWFSFEIREGKRGFRVYPIWDITISKQAISTQKWQLEYFYELNDTLDLKRVKSLYQN